jgi:hypothetical protein
MSTSTLLGSKGGLNRRQFLKKSAVGVVGATAALATGKVIVSPPDAMSPDPYPQRPSTKPEIPTFNENAQFFNEHQFTLVATIAALIVPTDDSPGATEAGVVNKLDKQAAGSEKMGRQYTDGLKWIDDFSRQRYGSEKAFLTLNVGEQIAFLRFIENTWAMRKKEAKTLVQRLDKKIDIFWDTHFGAGMQARFFSVIRRDVLRTFYATPIAWLDVGYFGPPQPVGYLDFFDPPSTGNYIDVVRPVVNTSCVVCHTETMTHPNGALIDHSCTTCHHPHEPWPDSENPIHLQDYAGFMFPKPFQKNGVHQ